MNWPRIIKNPAIVDDPKSYQDHKEQLREEANMSCIYCGLHESSLGGQRSYHVEHYKPKSKYPLLELEYENLFYACMICNVFKGNDWPSDPDPDLKNICYPNPINHDYNQLFDLDLTFFSINGNTNATDYLVNKLYLNRPQLILERKEYFMFKRYEQLKIRIAKLIDDIDSDDFEDLKQLFKSSKKVSDLLANRRYISNYEKEDISKK